MKVTALRIILRFSARISELTRIWDSLHRFVNLYKETAVNRSHLLVTVNLTDVDSA
jgi:hypothetical protein